MRAGGPEPFPRSLRLPVAVALPATVVLLPRLSVAGISTWLADQDVACSLSSVDRPLRACLVARYGHGVIFLDGTDSEDEQRFSLAHEVAHFLHDYWHPRQHAAERLGSGVLDAMDGFRPPRHDERIHAILARVSIDFHTHLMERTPDGHRPDAVVDEAERDADRLAFELLAPLDTLADKAAQLTAAERRIALRRHLATAYGLPPTQASAYADLIAPTPRTTPSLVRQMFSRD